MSAARAQSFLLFYPPSSPWFLLTLVEKTSNTFQGSLHVVRFSLDGVSGDLFETRPNLWAMCYFSLSFAHLPGWSPGWLASIWSVLSGWRAQRAFINSVHFAAATDWWCFVFRHCSKHRVERGGKCDCIGIGSDILNIWISFILEYWRYMLYICEPYGLFPFSGWCSYLTDYLLFWRENKTRVVLFERLSCLLDPVWENYIRFCFLGWAWFCFPSVRLFLQNSF